MLSERVLILDVMDLVRDDSLSLESSIALEEVCDARIKTIGTS